MVLGKLRVWCNKDVMSSKKEELFKLERELCAVKYAEKSLRERRWKLVDKCLRLISEIESG